MDITTIDTSRAKLPSTYHAAKRAISQCASLDECKDWMDKAAALASYAKQAQDDELEAYSKRIRARAYRRAGQLLQQIEPSKGGRPSAETTDPVVPSSRKDAAEASGLTEKRAKTAQRLANVPEDDFDGMIEQGATISSIAAAGTQRQPTEPNRDAARALVAALKGYAERLDGIDTDAALAALTVTQRSEVRMLVARLDGAHDRIVTRL